MILSTEIKFTTSQHIEVEKRPNAASDGGELIWGNHKVRYAAVKDYEGKAGTKHTSIYQPFVSFLETIGLIKKMVLPTLEPVRVWSWDAEKLEGIGAGCVMKKVVSPFFCFSNRTREIANHLAKNKVLLIEGEEWHSFSPYLDRLFWGTAKEIPDSGTQAPCIVTDGKDVFEIQYEDFKKFISENKWGGESGKVACEKIEWNGENKTTVKGVLSIQSDSGQLRNRAKISFTNKINI